MTDSIIDGFYFSDAADRALAEEEVARIKYIAGKMNMNNHDSVLKVYDKLISSGIFVTPVGIEYLRTLQKYLYKCADIKDEDVRDIPIAISYSDAYKDRTKEREKKIEARTFRKSFRREYSFSLIFNFIMLIGIIAMFFIALRSDTPNMINYRTTIVNQYSEWEQDLTNREEELKARELELTRQNQ